MKETKKTALAITLLILLAAFDGALFWEHIDPDPISCKAEDEVVVGIPWEHCVHIDTLIP